MKRRTNLLLAIVLLAVALVLLLKALNILPEGLYDLLLRAWPALLVLAGLSLLLRARLRFGGIAALVVSIALVVGLASLAFSTRAGQQREDNRVTIDQPIEAQVTTLQINVETLSTEVEISSAIGDQRRITGEFVGSLQSELLITYETTGEIATFTFIEAQPGGFPLLESIGRARLRLELPAGLAVGLAFAGENGTTTFNLDGINLERLNINLISGDAVVALPNYRPLLQSGTEPLGELAVRGGNITLLVPAEIAGRFELNRGGSSIRPDFDPDIYNFIDDRILEARGVLDEDIDIRYRITAPRGVISLQVIP